ncbi:MAG: S1 RNA-binding domain-containing protein [Phycisphaerae bacterium]
MSDSPADDRHNEDSDLDNQLEAGFEQELDEALGEMSLESLIDLDIPRGIPFAMPSAEGVKRGRVIAIHGDDIFVDMGGKSQGVLSATQYEDEPLPRVGDVVEVTIEGYDRSEGILQLSRKGAVMATTWARLEEGHIVEGRVTGHNKGGLEMDINGVKAFMPISQIELFRVEDTDLPGYVNRRLKCQVIEVRHEEKSIIVSRREVLRMEEEQSRERKYATLVEGQTVTGLVRQIMPYGAFVSLGDGVDGLLHIKDMSYSRVQDPKDVVKEGQKLELMVLKIDRDTRKISLGLKQVMPDPWLNIEVKYPVNSVITGRVTRLMDFGAFVELEPGVEGLVPISEMTYERRIAHPKDVLQEGEVVRVRVIRLDTAAKRLALSIKQVGDDPWVGASVRWPVNSVVSGTVKRIAAFGAFVELIPGVEGLVHISELSDQRVRSVGDVVKEGQSVQAKVLEVDEESRRISLSIKQLASVPEYTGESSASTAPAAEPKKRKKPLKGGLDWKF